MSVEGGTGKGSAGCRISVRADGWWWERGGGGNGLWWFFAEKGVLGVNGGRGAR